MPKVKWEYGPQKGDSMDTVTIEKTWVEVYDNFNKTHTFLVSAIVADYIEKLENQIDNHDNT